MVEQLKREAEERLKRNFKALENLFNSQEAFANKQQQKKKNKLRRFRNPYCFYFYAPKEYSYLINSTLINKVTNTPYPQFQGYNLYRLYSFHMISFNVLKQKIAKMIPLEFVKIPPQHMNNKRFLPNKNIH